MLFNHNINNLSGGVSQQTEEARYDNQVDEMVNFVPTVAQGLRRRNPINHKQSLGITYQDNMAIHSYSRGDGVEKYGMIIDDNGLKVFDANTLTLRTVNDFGSVGNTVIEQWAGTDWKNDIKFLTVGDTTWILNTSIVAQTTGATTPIDTNPYTAFYWIKKSFNDGTSGVNHGYTYQITINGNDYSYNHTDSISAAANLASQINALATFTARNEGSIVYIKCTTTFTMASGDSWGNQASVGWGSGVSKISDLPASMDGFTSAEVGTIAITGTDKDSFTNYYLKWDTDHWKETVKEGVEYLIDPMTMPAKLVRQGDGTFSLGWNVENLALDGFHTVWGERDKGDDDSNPLPSFIGNKISNMFFFKNRLGFTSEENVILSQTASYYDFFASTVIEILDTDPIDAAADSNNISIIRAVNVTAGAITLWTDTSQFILSGGDVLSPATTRISQTSSYVTHNELEPINVDNEVVFFNRKGNWLEALTYAPASINNDKSTAASLSSHIPEYLPSTIDSVETAPNENMLFMHSSDEPDAIYAYKYHIDNNKRVMSAWFKWTFEISIRKMNVLENELFLLAGSNDLYSMELPILELDGVFEDNGSYPYESYVTMSRFNIETKQGTQNIRENFYMKTIKSKVEGDVDLEIVNSERGTSKIIDTKHVGLERKLLIGGHSDKIRLKFYTDYPTGVSINTVNIEGQMKVRSRNA